MAKNKKRHSGSARTYQDLKRKEAQQIKALTDEALLPGKNGGRMISMLGALVMIAAFFLVYALTSLTLAPSLLIALLCGVGSILLATYFTIRRNRMKALREMKKK